MEYVFTHMSNPLKYPVVDTDGKTLIPKGATGVDIAFGQSSKTRKDRKTGKTLHQNVYSWNGQLYNC